MSKTELHPWNPIKCMILIVSCCISINGTTQDIIKLNQAIDQAVVNKDLEFLKDHYAEDFVFTHGTGLVDSKTSWINGVSKPSSKFISRIHDSVTVEPHAKNINIVYGKLTVKRQDKDNMVQYLLWYVRVFEKLKGRWQMVSHRTVREYHL
ncbi:MAG: nuclear transport factor 2 family protein [Saprospiraceae bacterium]